MIRYAIILTPVYVAFFWALNFLLNKFSANKARYWLGVFMTFVAVLYTCHAVFFFELKDIYLHVDFLYLITGLSVYPLYYIYIRLLTCDLHLKWSYVLHFIPAIGLGIALFLAHQFASPEERAMYYDYILLNNEWSIHEVSTGFLVLSSLFYLSRIIFGIQAIGYLFLGIYLVRKYNRRIADFYSNTEGRELKWVHLLTVSFLVTSALSTVANIIGRGLFLENTVLLSLPALLFSSLFFIIGLLGNRQDFTIRSFNNDLKNDFNCNRKPFASRNEKLKGELITLLETKKRFLDPDLKITDLCRELNTNRTYLSGLINSEFQLNFNDLINQYRVEYAIYLLKNGRDKNLSFQAIAAESGFGSLSSFTRAFKKNKKITITSFKQQMDYPNQMRQIANI